MISLIDFILEQKIIKQTETKNYNVDDYKNPPKNKILGYRKKVIIDKSGTRHLLTLALIKDPITGKTKTKATSFWHPK
jgi:hypothetical protein